MNQDTPDHIEERRQQWARELPELDTRGMAVLGRARVITHMARPAIEAVFERHGLNTGEFDVLSSLLRSGPPYALRPTELYSALMITSGGLTGRLARLERAGLIERLTNTADKRSYPVQLTTKGLECARAAIKEDMAVEAAMLDCLTEAEQATLSSLLRKLSKALEGQQQ